MSKRFRFIPESGKVPSGCEIELLIELGALKYSAELIANGRLLERETGFQKWKMDDILPQFVPFTFTLSARGIEGVKNNCLIAHVTVNGQNGPVTVKWFNDRASAQRWDI